MAVLFLIGGNTEVQAQRNQGNKKQWKQIEKAEKQRGKYIRKQNKEYVKYFRDLRKEEKKWAKTHGYNARHHIYFTDYRTFYDPYRGGYVFLNGGNWGFSVNIPSFLINVDLGRARTRILRDVPVTRHPEDFYYDFNEGYW